MTLSVVKDVQNGAMAKPRRASTSGTRVDSGGRQRPQQLAGGLGWFSLGLGVAKLLAPRVVARAVGLETVPSRLAKRLPESISGATRSHETMMRLFGLREIVLGLGLLSQRRPSGWVWARLAGDLLDLGVLGAAMRSDATDVNKARLAAATAAATGVAALDAFCGRQLASRTSTSDGGFRVVHSIAVNRTPAECYAYWRDLESLPRFMHHIDRVTTYDDRRSHWVVRGPSDTRVAWDVQILLDRPAQMIAWESVEGSVLDTEGSVRFLAGQNNRGTLVRLTLRYRWPSALTAMAARLFGKAPEQRLREDLRRFKQLVEVGTIMSTSGQPHGPERGVLARMLGNSTARQQSADTSPR